MTTSEVPFRILPKLTERNAHFWQGGRDGELRFQRCQDCGYYLHPPAVICPRDWSRNIGIEAVSGRAEVLAYSVNHQASSRRSCSRSWAASSRTTCASPPTS